MLSHIISTPECPSKRTLVSFIFLVHIPSFARRDAIKSFCCFIFQSTSFSRLKFHIRFNSVLIIICRYFQRSILSILQSVGTIFKISFGIVGCGLNKVFHFSVTNVLLTDCCRMRQTILPMRCLCIGNPKQAKSFACESLFPWLKSTD